LENIFLDDEDRRLFLKTLGEASKKTGWRVHSYVQMGNHYHLLLETPEANLSIGMHWLQSTYTIRHNMRHRKRGHLFQGRYKAIPVESGDGMYFRTASDYIHLNPVRAGWIEEGKKLESYAWSSFPALIGVAGKRPGWLCGGWVLEQGDTAGGRRIYRKHMEQRAAEEREGGTIDLEMLAMLRKGWIFGSEAFREAILERFEKEGGGTPARRSCMMSRKQRGLSGKG
jgi:putative transposase